MKSFEQWWLSQPVDLRLSWGAVSIPVAEAAYKAGMESETTALKSRIAELERIAEANHIAAMEARQNERTAMAYLNDVRMIVGDCDYPTMVERVCKLMEGNHK